MEMELTFTDKASNREIIFSDFDDDKEIDVTIIDFDTEEKLMYWMDKENIISLKKHLEYLLTKI